MTPIMRHLLCFAFLGGLSVYASATTYTYEAQNPSGSDRGGDLRYISLNYSDSDESLFGSFSLKRKNHKLANTGWMVLSPGGNPKNGLGDQAIMYMDFRSGDSWLYQYNGNSNNNSYRNSPFLGHFENSLTVRNNRNQRNVSFNYDLSNVQPQTSNWTGMSFGDRVGVWFHALVGRIRGDEEGINRYQQARRYETWHDTSNSVTHSVPEIDAAGLPLVATLLVSLFVIGRERFGKH